MAWLIWSFKWLVRPREISLNASSISVEETHTYQLVATITPSNAINQDITWISSDPSIATVDSNWLVTAIAEWQCTITVRTNDRWITYESQCDVWVVRITSFVLNESSVQMEYWTTKQLTVTISPNNATYQWVTRTSSNTSIATVSDTWLVTPVNSWNCTITCTSDDWVHSATCSFSINWTHVTWVTLNTNSFTWTVWNTYQLTATITPSNASVKKINWSSSDASIASVSSTWLVTIKKTGNVTITATTADWWYTAQCIITCQAILDFLLVWWWWAGWRARCRAWWWGGAWWLLYCTNFSVLKWSYPIVIWAWWTADVAQYDWSCWSWWNSTALWLTAYWWGWGGWMNTYSSWNAWASWWSWWWASWCSTVCSSACSWQWNIWWAWCLTRGWWWGWAWWAWCNAACWWNYYGWAWWDWCCLDIAWEYYWYSAGWWWGWCTWVSMSCWWWCWWNYRVAWYAAACYWSGWWWGWCTACSSCCISWWNWYQWVFIISYPSWCWYTITWWTKYLCNWKCIHCFTTDWTLVVN